jgi:FMN phosphatase YigB (HAD superfamily)
MRASGPGRPDPEPTHRALLAETLRIAGHGVDDGDALLARLEALELDAIFRLTRLDPVAVELLQRANAAGLRLLITSDMYLSAASLSLLLQWHGLKDFARIYVSSEHGRTKFSGRLFDHLLQNEGVPASRVLHVGDHPWSDGISPASRGIRSRWIGPPSTPRFVRSAVLSRPLESDSPDAAVHLGRGILGQAIASALPILRSRLEALSPDLVLYVARDGELLLQLMDAAGLQPSCRVAYALLSRRSTLAASLHVLDQATAIELLTVRRSNRGLLTLFGGLGMDQKHFASHALSAGFTSLEEPIVEPARDQRLDRLLRSISFQERFVAETARQRELLRGYLADLGYFDARRVVLIDLGWRGSIQDALDRAFTGDPAMPELYGLYLGLWDEGLVGSPRSQARRQGVLSDRRRGQHLLEAALPELGLALEPIFRARHGTVLGYRQEGATVRAVLEEATDLARSFERQAEGLSDRIRQGVLEGIRAESPFLPSASSCRDLRIAQFRLARLAYFPSRLERRLLGCLPVTEGADSAWALPAVLCGSSEGPPGLLNRLRRWCVGLESPWRAGYVAETLGLPGSLLYVLAQMGWLAIPSGWKRALRSAIQRQVYVEALPHGNG